MTEASGRLCKGALPGEAQAENEGLADGLEAVSRHCHSVSKEIQEDNKSKAHVREKQCVAHACCHLVAKADPFAMCGAPELPLPAKHEAPAHAHGEYQLQHFR